jgi:hypothetical protein
MKIRILLAAIYLMLPSCITPPITGRFATGNGKIKIRPDGSFEVIVEPHSLVIELKQPLTVRGFIYTPRKDCDHGRIARYRIHASDDGKNWKPITEGTWDNSDRPQTVRLESPSTARFFKLESLQEVQNRNWTSVAEFDVIVQ